MKARSWDREALHRCTERIIRPGERARPDVRVVALDGRRWVVKDYGFHAPLFKRLLGMYLVSRERFALQRAQGIPGVPMLGPVQGPCLLTTELMDAVEVTSAPPQALTAEFFALLHGLVQTLHRRGVVHGDLKKLENILISRDGKPVLVDFTAAFVSGSSPVTALVFPWIADDDNRAICKLKRQCAPHLLTQQELAFLEERSGVERFFRWFRRYIRYLVKRWSTPKKVRGSIELK